jgi:tetrahydromethanopterin S-methyltransferase subunit D
MRGGRGRGDGERRGLFAGGLAASPAGGTRAAVGETITLLRRYVVQETIGPLKGIARTFAYGLAGSLLLGIGGVVLLLALLRALQTETASAFAGSWSFAPFLISAVVALAAAGAAAVLGVRGSRRAPVASPSSSERP